MVVGVVMILEHLGCLHEGIVCALLVSDGLKDKAIIVEHLGEVGPRSVPLFS